MHDSATAIHYTCSHALLSHLYEQAHLVYSFTCHHLASLPLAGWLELISGTHCLYLYLFIFNVKMHISKPLTSQLLSQFTAILGFAGPHCVCSLLLHFLYAWILNGGLSWNEKQHTLSQVKLKYLHISIDGTLDWLRLHIYILHVHGLVVNELFRSSCAVVCDGTQLAQMCMLGLRLQWRVVSVT